MDKDINTIKMEKECTDIRNQIRDLAGVVRTLMADPGIMSLDDDLHGEAKANIMLSFRHLEDARMRIGKVMQALQGGVSKFDEIEQLESKTNASLAKAVDASSDDPQEIKPGGQV